jgi:hypothetical protein
LGFLSVMVRAAAGRPVRMRDVVFILVFEWRAMPATSRTWLLVIGMERFLTRLTTTAVLEATN